MRLSQLLSLCFTVLLAAVLLSPGAAIAQDNDGDGYPASIDCDDNNPDIKPGADEVCDDGIDQDCSPNSCIVDEETGEEDCFGGDLLSDLDEDTFLSTECGGDDCDDDDATLNNLDADADTFTSCDGDCDDADASIDLIDDDGDLTNDCEGDCDDTEAAVGPHADEVCGDELDNDCDGTPDNIDVDGDGAYSPECGGDDCDDLDASLTPTVAETGAVCNDEIDNDCDTLVDNLDDDCFEAPEASAGESQQDRYLGGNIVVVLDGSDTTDFNGADELTYTWTVTPAEDYPEVTWAVELDPTSPYGFFRFHATSSERQEFVFNATLIVSDGVPETEDSDSNISVRIWRPDTVPPSNCSTVGDSSSSLVGFGLLLGLVAIRRRRD
jgi:MYXO-CTERM domain-containing protein